MAAAAVFFPAAAASRRSREMRGRNHSPGEMKGQANACAVVCASNLATLLPGVEHHTALLVLVCTTNKTKNKIVFSTMPVCSQHTRER